MKQGYIRLAQGGYLRIKYRDRDLKRIRLNFFRRFFNRIHNAWFHFWFSKSADVLPYKGLSMYERFGGVA